MTTRDQNRSGIDPSHVLAICTSAGHAGDRPGTALLGGGRDGLHVYLPRRARVRDVQAALSRVGYDVIQSPDRSQGRHLVVRGWSSDALDARLIAMRSVLEKLAADPGSTATRVLDRLGNRPQRELPDAATQRQLSLQAAARLLRWIFTTSGVHAPRDPLARPADPACALRLSATWRLEEAIEDLAARQVRVAANALSIYPVLRQQMDHDSARDLAVRRAGVTFHLSRRVAQDTTPLLRSARAAPLADTPAPKAAAQDAPGPGRPGSRCGGRGAQVIPFTAAPVRPSPSRPPAAARARGRNRPSGSARPRP